MCMMIDQTRYDVISVGETTVDAFMSIHNASAECTIDEEHNALCFKHGKKVEVDRYDFCMGGNATNVAVGLSRLGVRTGLCSEIGDDEFSIKIRNWLAKENIERLLVKQTTNSASSFAVIINFNGDRTIFVQDVEREHDFDFGELTAPWVYLTSLGKEWIKPYEKVLSFVEEHNAKIAFNPGGRQLREGKELLERVLQKTEILFVNKEEAEIILEKPSTDKRDEEYMKELIEGLKKRGPKTVVITDGRHGAFTLNGDGKMHHQTITEGKVVERTGAGDSFSSGFLAATLAGHPVSIAMEWGAHNATSVVGRIGAQAGLLTKKEMEELVGD